MLYLSVLQQPQDVAAQFIRDIENLSQTVSINQHHLLNHELVKIKKDIALLVSEAKVLPGFPEELLDIWQTMSDAFGDEVSKDIVRVAVIGPIKSGKSTFVNSLYHRDYLKRGAGVVTSIVTRIRYAEKLRAILYFKSWKEINAEMEQALVLFPALNHQVGNQEFDIRLQSDREVLSHALDSLNADQYITDDSLNANTVLLQSYLNGYERMYGYIAAENGIHVFEGDAFPEHRRFVGDDALSVYLRDIQLEVNDKDMENPVEIADCQGSDSPNPLHLAMIQDYLYRTHLIIYVISSRTGLRRADIKFLTMIKKIGILDNALFVVNCDISEHEAIEDLSQLLEKINTELSFIVPEPKLFALSALFNLLRSMDGNLTPKDKDRLAGWEKQLALVEYTKAETDRFNRLFYGKLARDKIALLLSNHLDRLNVLNRELQNWLMLYRDVLDGEKADHRTLIDRIKPYEKKVKQVAVTVKNTIDGATPKIKKEVKRDIDRFFDNRSDATLGGIVDFIRRYSPAPRRYVETLQHTGFSGTVYMMFQDFKHDLDQYMTERVNPEVLSFLAWIEQRVQTSLEDIASPYDLLVQDTLNEYKKSLSAVSNHLKDDPPRPVRLGSVDSIKAIAGIEFSPPVAAMRYSARIRSEAVVRLGFYTMAKIFKKILRKTVDNEKEEQLQALKDGMQRIKQEMEKSMVTHFRDYRENIKFQYIFKLTDAMANKLCDVILERLNLYTADLSGIIEKISIQQVDKNEIVEKLSALNIEAIAIGNRIGVLKNKLIDH